MPESVQHHDTDLEPSGSIDAAGPQVHRPEEHGLESPAPATEQPAAETQPDRQASGFLPSQPPRLAAESVLVRVVATIGVVAIGTGLGALLVAQNVAGWIVGLAVAALSVVLAAVLWRSREM